MDTGFPSSDAKDDFSRQRRRQVLAQMRGRMVGRSGAVGMMLPFDEVVAAMGLRGERFLGARIITLDSIVGSVDRTSEFDRRFRPTSRGSAQRFERINAALRRGEEMPPIEVYRVAEMHFVRDGHHRVAVARAMGWKDINALVTEVLTDVGGDRDLTLDDLPLKSHERVFYERVPLPAQWRHRIVLRTGDAYGDLAEAVEAWGFRYLQQHRELLDRHEIATAWFTEEYAPTIELLREAGLLGEGSETEGYMRLSALRYKLLRSHTWDDEVLAKLR